MPSIRTVNLTSERRLRGSYPISRFALDNAGIFTLAVPRPLETRTYDVTRFHLDGSSDVLASFAAETLLRLEVGADSGNCVGMTIDDVYLFTPGHKGRFLGERHHSYVDAALSRDGLRLAVGFSDRAGASYAVAYGEVTGRVAWTQDADAGVSVVAISPEGARIAMGSDGGQIGMLDTERRQAWQFESTEPIRALACSPGGAFTAFGTGAGTVGLLTSEGARRWSGPAGGAVTALAIDDSASMIVAICARDGEAGGCRIVIFGSRGSVLKELETERSLVGAALSPDGSRLAVSARGGVHLLYEIETIVEAEGAAPHDSALASGMEKARTLLVGGEPTAALGALRSAAEAHPLEPDAALAELHTTVLDAIRKEAEHQMALGELDGCIAGLEAALLLEPDVHALSALLRAGKTALVNALRDEAQQQAAGEQLTAAESCLRRALAVDPYDADLRLELRSVVGRRVSQLDSEARLHVEQKEWNEGIRALELAESLLPAAERRRRIESVLTEREIAAGLALYNEKRYPEAVFQFRKALARDGSSAEAQRYLAFAERFAADASRDQLVDRFSKLE